MLPLPRSDERAKTRRLTNLALVPIWGRLVPSQFGVIFILNMECSMTDPTPDFVAVIHRLEKLERQNRRLKMGGLGLITLFLIAGAWVSHNYLTWIRQDYYGGHGFSLMEMQEPWTVGDAMKIAVGKTFPIADDRVQFGGGISMRKGKTGLNFVGDDGQATLYAGRKGSNLALADSAAHIFMGTSLYGDKTMLEMQSRDGRYRLRLGVDQAGGSFLDVVRDGHETSLLDEPARP